MSDRQHRRWITFAVLGLPLYLAGCGGTAGPVTSIGSMPADAAASDDSDIDATDLMRVADRLRASGDARNAAALYRQAHLTHPDLVLPLVHLGDTLMEIGANAEASDAYGKALDLDPKNQDALRGLGISRVLLAQPQFAVAPFEAALALDGRDIRSHNGLGIALDMLGEHAAAQETYRAALAVEPKNQKLLNNLGLSLALSGDREESVAILEQVNAAPAATALTRQNLALAYGLSGRLDAAAEIARIDLQEAAVERNLAFYAAHDEPGRADTVAGALGIQRNGVHYLASLPAIASDADAVSMQTGARPAAAPIERVREEVIGPAPTVSDPSLGSTPPLRRPTSRPAAEHAPAPADGAPAKTTSVRRPPPRQSHPVRAATATADAAMRRQETPLSAETTETPVLIMAMASADPDAAPLYHIQLAAYRSEDEAKAGWDRLAKAESDLLADLDPIVRQADLGPDDGVYFRLQAGGFLDQQTASALCRDLLARQVDCLVVRGSAAPGTDAAKPADATLVAADQSSPSEPAPSERPY